MVFDSDFVLYASISRRTTVLAEFINSSSIDGGLETLASQCLERYPQLHLSFSHTIRKRIYSFSIDDPFVFFAIIDEKLGKSTSFELLECVKDAFFKILRSNSLKSVDGFENLTRYSFQDELEPVFASLIVRDCEVRALHSPGETFLIEDCRKNEVLMMKKKKNRRSVEEMTMPMMKSDLGSNRENLIDENMIDVLNGDEGRREFGVSAPKKIISNGRSSSSSCSVGLNGNKMWRRHVWTVLVLDLVVCFGLFGVWLWVCKGFECLAN
ncbi:hypothetical protein Syun_019643 [Stephania yunnanensis]|uniref:Longin domain-containing protein n=1 Tax=Stephania yunnanensis TaxID=152371 RepID=A0AAP0IWV7_9MAGN